MKKTVWLLTLLLTATASFAQMGGNPVSWSSEIKEKGSNEYEVVFKANIPSPWHIYDLKTYKNGPISTAFTLETPEGVELRGGIAATVSPTVKYDDVFKMDIGYFSGSVGFVQKVRTSAPHETELKATVEWQACDETSCRPPAEHEFSIKIPAAKQAAATVQPTQPAQPAATTTTAAPASQAAAPVTESATVPEEPAATKDTTTAPQPEITPATPSTVEAPPTKSMWAMIVEAVLWGFAALLTPCVFPMVPMTVSFFMRDNQNKRKGRFMALMYGIFIVALYTLPIAIIVLSTYFVGGASVTAGIFNWLATHWLPNIIFFLVFMIFAASFFGAFEIVMPSKLVNKSDRGADKGGLAGVFFMALTLVLVSFSCTGPIVGSVLIKSTQGDILEPIFAMLAFSVAFALPFTLFAFFPSWLGSLPKSGGWLNSVKVVLGFIELALGLKFLSVADQTYHWGLLDREVYLALWIVIFTLLGVYLLGKLKFRHDSDLKHVGVTRLFLAIATLSFVVYLVPGMFGAPLKALSGYLPPRATLDFNLTEQQFGRTPVESNPANAPKYSDFLHMAQGLNGYFDYKEGIEVAKKENKPVMLDFTGHGCVNCREMEANVLSALAVSKILNEEYILIAIYVDDKKELPENEWVVNAQGKTLKTLGKINTEFAITRWHVNSQPTYILIDPFTEKELAPRRAHDLDREAFIRFLETGKKTYSSRPEQQ